MGGLEEKFGEVQSRENAKDDRATAILERGKLAIRNRELENQLQELKEENTGLSLQVRKVKMVLEGARDHNVELEEKVQRLERVVMEKEKLSKVDTLTGLLNRNAFETVAPTMFETFQSLVREAYAKPGESGKQANFNAIYIDLNDFKPINDSLGHAAGDLALKQVAAALRAAVRGTDKIFRMGGDEFLVLFVGHEEPVKGITTVIEDRGIIASRIVRHLERTGFEYNGQKVPAMTASIGAVVAHPNESLTDLVARADAAVYEAKAVKKPGTSAMVVEGLEANDKK